jgi:hypothetical protein
VLAGRVEARRRLVHHREQRRHARQSPREGEFLPLAATIKAAIRAKLAGRASRRDEDLPPDTDVLAGGELSSEVSWLESVAAAFSASPLVDAVTASPRAGRG